MIKKLSLFLRTNTPLAILVSTQTNKSTKNGTAIEHCAATSALPAVGPGADAGHKCAACAGPILPARRLLCLQPMRKHSLKPEDEHRQHGNDGMKKEGQWKS